MSNQGEKHSDPPPPPPGPEKGSGPAARAHAQEPTSPQLVAKVLGAAKALGASDKELHRLQQDAATMSEQQCADMLATMQDRLKNERGAEEKRAERERAKTEREAREERKVKLAKRGLVLCRAKKTCLAGGIAYYEGQEFTLPKGEAERRLSHRRAKGEFEIV